MKSSEMGLIKSREEREERQSGKKRNLYTDLLYIIYQDFQLNHLQ